MTPNDPTPKTRDATSPRHFANPGSHRRTAQSRWFAGSRATPDVPPAGFSLHGSRKPGAAKDVGESFLERLKELERNLRPTSATPKSQGKGGLIAVLHNTRSPE